MNTKNNDQKCGESCFECVLCKGKKVCCIHNLNSFGHACVYWKRVIKMTHQSDEKGERMSKKLPRLQIDIGKSLDGFVAKVARDKIGNVSISFWKEGVGFHDNREVRIDPRDVYKLRDYLNKIIEYVDRS